MTQTYDEALYLQQVELEQEMTRLGAEKYERDVTKASQQGAAGERTKHGRQLVAHHTEALAKAIQEFIDDTKSGRAGRHQLAAKFLERFDDLSVPAVLGLRTLLSSINDNPVMFRLSLLIGDRLEDELNYASLRDEDEKMYLRLKKRAGQRGSYHNKKTLIQHVASKEGKTWEHWKTQDKVKVGSKLIDLIVDLGLVDIRSITVKGGTQYFVYLTEKTKEWIDKYNATQALLMPFNMPMVVPPVPWEGPRGGGYLTRYVRPLRFLRARSQEHNRLIDEADMPLVYEAVNHIQSVPWQINRDILVIMNELYESGAQWATIPSAKEEEFPPKPANIGENEEARRHWKKAVAQTYLRNVKASGKRVQFNQNRFVADRLKDYEAIYFPHTVDFRGRVYPMTRLTPQGPDHARALLRFATGKPLGDAGLKWFTIHGANLAGVDKVSFQERINFVEANEDEIVEIAADPFSVRSWVSGFARGSKHEKVEGEGLEIDKPFQFLAWCLEYAQMVHHCNTGEPAETFVSHLPIAMDGSCSGIQHYSMALRDPVGADAVNLTANEEPQDIYKRVADIVSSFLIEDQNGYDEKAAALAKDWLTFGVSRKVCKRPVMTFPYGSGRYGYKEQILHDTVLPARAEGKFPGGGDGFAHANYLAKQIAKALPLVIQKATEGMTYLQKVARVVTAEEKPVRWVTPLGFPVYQDYPNLESERVSIMFGGKQMRLSSVKPVEGINNREQVQGISPNFIHSLDATHLMMTVLEAQSRGVDSMALVHDSFGTHAADADELFRTLRETMAYLYSEFEVFRDFHNQVRAYLSEDGKTELDKLEDIFPTQGSLDPTSVNEADYAFA